MRVVSLLPSATEIVHALGVEPMGVSHECDHPPAAAEKPSINRSRIDADATSAEINEQVATAERGGGVYEIDLDALREADPDLIVTQGVCDVCAVDRVLVAEAVEELELDCEILTTDPHSLDDLLDDVERIGAAVGRATRATELVAELRGRIDAVERRAATAEAERRPRTLVLDWLDPVMVAGHWVPGMIGALGAEYGLAAPGARSEPHEWAEIRAFDPEVLVVAPCGFDLDQIRENAADLLDREGWAELTAVREGEVYAMDGHEYVNRPGPRLVETFEYVAALVHPDRFERPPADAVRPFPSADGVELGGALSDG